MTAYSLEINIDQAGLDAIAGADLSVALLQPQENAAYQMVAVLTSALGTMHISWTDSESIFVSVYSLTAYSVPQIAESKAALSGQKFTYDGVAITQSGSTSLPETIQLDNNSGSSVTSGLARSFTVNGSVEPVTITSATSVLQKGLASFQMSNTMLLTLLGGAQLGMALPSQTIPGFQQHQVHKRSIPAVSVQPPLLLDFTAGNTSRTVHYDDLNNTFVEGPLA